MRDANEIILGFMLKKKFAVPLLDGEVGVLFTVTASLSFSRQEVGGGVADVYGGVGRWEAGVNGNREDGTPEVVCDTRSPNCAVFFLLFPAARVKRHASETRRGHQHPNCYQAMTLGVIKC